jgi:hypothetical protein
MAAGGRRREASSGESGRPAVPGTRIPPVREAVGAEHGKPLSRQRERERGSLLGAGEESGFLIDRSRSSVFGVQNTKGENVNVDFNYRSDT